MEEEIITKQLRHFVMTKRLNILIGSGASMPVIPLMSHFKTSSITENEANNQLSNKVKEVSKKLVEDSFKNSDNESIELVLKRYRDFLSVVIKLLYHANSRQVTKNINIFSTNYDLFIEKAIDKLMKHESFVFNDGSNGYFNRILDGANYNKSVAYRGLSDNYLNELPTISLIKPHGSMNWEKDSEDNILIRQNVVDNPVIVKPTGLEGQETYLNNHFHDMLRVFQLELDKPQSILIVIGFSFQDKHIAKMLNRALRNPELSVFIFCYCDNDKQTILKNLSLEKESRNLKIITPNELEEMFKEKHEEESGETWSSFDISNLTMLLDNFSFRE
ncbi:SIR2 family protein [Streptococcus sanguinis]|uniref:SIR2 family protein n=1 Tax=Streptococcus sanguinis TaxID=1305 RepID=UPI001CC0EC62|nr:SIR2 family protein [Streptococcus sanguinis]MBZ2038109.1 SIR2 family protein [Streptococcus sanguinis]MBZ2069018.1 SIR2 family protein [Streptococcus sanguinis]MBZ2070491.1 SIR2 family protein [Streptococcus sanguinis]